MGIPTRLRQKPYSAQIGLWSVLLILLLVVAAPLIALLLTAITGYGDEGSALPQLWEPHMVKVLRNTLWLGFLVVVFATLMAAPLAALMAFTPLGRHRWIDIVLMVPFMTPPFVAAMAWMDFTRLGGVADMLLGSGAGTFARATVFSVWGMAIIMACEIFPFLYLLLRNRCETLPASGIEMARIAQASSWDIASRIVFPQLVGPYTLGALIVFIRAIGEFGTPVTLGNAIGYRVFVSQIHQDVTIDPLDFSSAAAGSSALFSLGVTVWAIQQWISRHGIKEGGRITRPWRAVPPRWLGALGWLWVAVIVAAAVVIPYISIFLGATTILRSQPPTLDNLTLDYFGIVLRMPGAQEALKTSAGLAAVSATASVLLGLAIVLVMAHARGWVGKIVDFLAIAPETMPAIVLAIGFIFWWNSPLLPVTPYNTALIMVIAYSTLFLPMVVQNIKTSAASVAPSVYEAAATSGASASRILWRITLPLLLPGMLAGWLIAFLTGIRELVMSSLVRPANMQLLSPWIMGQFDQGHRAEAMAMTVIGVVSSTVVLVTVQLVSAQRRQKSRVSAS